VQQYLQKSIISSFLPVSKARAFVLLSYSPLLVSQ